MSAPATLEALRARIRALEGGARVVRRRAPSGVDEVDELLGGLPKPGIVEVCGAPGSGRVRWVGALLAAATQRRRLVAWVDPLRRLHPPALHDLGVELPNLLVVRPPEDGTSPWLWATEQLLRSGCFELVVVERPPVEGKALPRRPVGARWARAAEHGQSTALVLGERPARQLSADVRVSVGGGAATVVRDRGGPGGGRAPLPAWPRAACPW